MMTEREEQMVLQAALGMMTEEDIERVILSNPELKKSYEDTLKWFDELKAEYGEEEFKKIEFDVPYSYE